MDWLKHLAVDIVRQLRTTSLPLLAALLLGDFLFIAAHLGSGFLAMVDVIEEWPSILRMGSDRGPEEIFMYVKWAALSCVMLIVAIREKALLALALAFFFFVLLLDDSLSFHERGSSLFRDTLLSGLRQEHVAQAVGELVFWSLMAVVLILPLAFGWWAADAALRRKVVPMAPLFGGLVVCGAGVDFVHALHPGGLTGILLDTADHGGELIFASALLAYAAGAFLGRSDTAQTAGRAD